MARLINPSAKLFAETVTLGDLLRSSGHQVPDYQRDFSWSKEDEISKFWDDIVKTESKAYPSGQLQSDPEPHFLGAIVTQKPPSGAATYPEVIDGQQRLGVYSMLVSVLYEFAQGLTDINARTNVTTQLLPLIADAHGSGRSPRLRLARDQDFYDQSVVQHLTMASREAYWATVKIDDKHPVRQRIQEAIKFLYEKVADFRKSAPDPDAALIRLADSLTELVIVLHLQVMDHRMAYRVFETLNFRGLDLSQADLIKNELVRRAQMQGTRHDVVKHWGDVVESLDSANQLTLVEFLQFHYASKYGAVRASDLFETVIGYLDDQGVSAKSYAQDLVDEAKRLVTLVEGDASVWSADANRALEDIRDTLNVKFAYPLLMAAAARFLKSPTDFNKWAVYTRNFCFRFFTIERRSVGAFADVTTKTARMLRDVAQPDSSALDELRKASPDPVFVDAFAKATVSTNKMGFYVIRSIEDHIKGGSGTTLPQGPAQHLEHIMPKKPGSSWSHVSTSPLYDSYLMRIGNLLGLEQPINSYVKNKAFSDKYQNNAHKGYVDSKMDLPPLTQQYLENGLWTFGSIEKRQLDLAAQLAVATWPL